MRFSAGPPARRATDRPDRSPLTSATNTGTPATESCSVMSWSAFVLPVPVAPATRPWRFIVASGTPHGGLAVGTVPVEHGAARDRRAAPSVV